MQTVEFVVLVDYLNSLEGSQPAQQILQSRLTLQLLVCIYRSRGYSSPFPSRAN